MSFFKNLENAFQTEDEITLFDASDKGYYAYLRLGGRLDIIHAFNFQPPIENFDDYYSFMFVESLQGFFVLRQRIIENKERPWHIFLELAPREPAAFFSQACSLRQKLQDNRWHKIGPRADCSTE
ncbi:MAG: hypothetical protein WCX65_06370 [bacterium]